MVREKQLETVLVIISGFLILHLIWAWMWPIYVIAGLLFVSLFIKRLLELIIKGWYKLGHLLGLINSTILLSIVFYILLTPIALVYRIFKSRKKTIYRETFFVKKDNTYKPQDLDNMW